MFQRFSVVVCALAMVVGCVDSSGSGDDDDGGAIDAAVSDAAPDGATPDEGAPPDGEVQPDEGAPPDMGEGDGGCTPSEEVCDGVDNDCDGEVDDVDGLGVECEVGLGVCAALGRTVCGPDGVICDVEAGAPTDEVCDGLDNDCDGEVDDVAGLGEACEVGVGACAATGEVVCGPDGLVCDAVEGAPGVEVCDGVDNDCDGEVDDVDGVGEACTAGLGACLAAGATVCGPDGELVCDAVAGAPSAEVCDGADNDCDGEVDDVDGLGEPCEAGVGACLAAGTTVCGPGGVVCDAVAGAPRAEVCDGVDNDCDGEVDDVDGLGEGCTAGVGACAVDGIQVCQGGALVCDAVPRGPGREVCDGVDNDCNGAVDDVAGIGRACTAGVGACAANGQQVCGPDGGLVCDAVPGAPVAEVCDDVDNDCNGTVDDAPVCDARERGEVLLCGNSARDMSTLIEPGDRVVFSNGCAPDDTTLAMLVSRGGAAQVDDAGWTAYVRGGGRIITEYSSSDEVFNAVFDAAVVAGRQSGACSDNVNPAFRLNEDDPFWRANAALPLTPAGETGCGLDLSGYPGIVALGGHTAGAVHLAYRELDAGRVYLVEGDWQDVDQAGNPAYFSAASRALMRAMIFGEYQVPARAQVGSFQVGDGPDWSGPDAVALSCVAVCAQLFGGVAAGYGCSTVDGEYNGQAYVSGWGDGQYCGGEGVAEDFVLPAEGAPYDCGVERCAYSAYVSDHCAASTNYCWSIGAPAVPRAVLMRCGSSDRDVAAFAPPEQALALELSCAPRDDVQALLVTRTGAGQLDAAALRAYLDAGGIVITEYNVSDEVYNAALGGGAVQGAGRGGCSDQVNPPVRVNLDDPFWQANGGLPLGGANTGCGFDVGGFPGVTPLGGWDAQTTSLAYIDVGQGRLWLVDIDWQDPDEGFGPASLQLMQYMVGHRR